MSELNLATHDDGEVLHNRRRPGRTIGAELLIPLLRNPVGDGKAPADNAAIDFRDHEISGPVIGRGFFDGLIFAGPASLILWALILGGAWLLVR